MTDNVQTVTTVPANRQNYEDVVHFGICLILYVIAALAFIYSSRDQPLGVVQEGLLLVPAGALVFLDSLLWFVPAILLLVYRLEAKERVSRISSTVILLLACSIFTAFFVLVKTTLVYVAPFHLDGALERLDRALHFGIRPIELTMWFSDWINPKVAFKFYFSFWAMPAFYLPVILALSDSDWPRRRRFYNLYFFSFVFLGGICALLGMSAGPVYHDYLVSEARFADLEALQRQAGLLSTSLPRIQASLWHYFTIGENGTASGISAFPSVHVAMASVIGFYIIDRWRWLTPLGIALMAWYLFLSVYTGWHYAVDGYFSILAVWAFWYWQFRRDRRGAVDRSGEAA